MIAVAVVLLLSTGAYVGFLYARPYLHGSNCQVKTAQGTMPLDLEQAANAATIAAVAIRKDLPERAAVIAYATAIQESELRNLDGGDRDSVGMFQQRPSQGWGTARQLRDPVQATSKFFDALVKVRDYLDRDLHDAAQRVQRSADGTAYAKHEPRAKVLAQAYMGREPGAVRCWFSPNRRQAARREAALRLLRMSFGSRLKPTADGVRVSGGRGGWAIASWAVAHAQPYGLTEVRYAGLRWRADDGHAGWTKDPTAPADRVTIT